MKSKKKRSVNPQAKPRKRGTGRMLPGVLEAWNAQGYLSPQQAAELKGVAKSTVYGWAARGVLKDPEGRSPSAVKKGAFKWFLRRAVEAMGVSVEAIDGASA